MQGGKSVFYEKITEFFLRESKFPVQNRFSGEKKRIPVEKKEQQSIL